MHQNINGKGNKNEEKKINLHGKPGDVSEKLNFNSDSESGPSGRDNTEHLINNPNFYDDMVSFDKTTVQFLQKIYFHRNVLKFVLSCIQRFDAKITTTNNS